MNPVEQNSEPSSMNVADLARAVRFALAALVVGLSYFSISGSLGIQGFGAIYNDMLNGRPLPMFTEFILRARPLFVASSVFVPVAAVALLFSRRLIPCIYIIGVLGLLSLGQIVALYYWLMLPLFDIISSMSAVPPQ
jgi:hypothetical protein